jgi:hypothetical protein
LASSPFDTDLPSTTIPAGSIVGANIGRRAASSTTTINGFLVRYRTNATRRGGLEVIGV